MDGCLYVFGADDGAVKIGISIQPKVRRSQVVAASGRSICREFVSAPFSWYREAEKYLHEKFSERRMNGEWFDIDFDEACKAADLIGVSLSPGEWATDTRYLRGVEAREVFIAFMDSDPSDGEIAAFLLGFGSRMDDAEYSSLCDSSKGFNALLSVASYHRAIFGDSSIVKVDSLIGERIAPMVSKCKALLEEASGITSS